MTFDRFVEVPMDWWLIAERVGLIRERENNGKRHHTKDLGAAGAVADRVGALGEIFLAEALSMRPDGDRLRERMCHFGSGKEVEGSDLLMGEVKTFDCAENKRYFAINRAKHQKYNKVEYYVAVLVRDYGRVLWSTLIPYEAVSSWQQLDLRRNGDVCLALPIELLSGKEILAKLREVPPYSESERITAWRGTEWRKVASKRYGAKLVRSEQ